MSKLDELIKELCPNGVRIVTLGEVAHYAKKRIDASMVNETNYIGVENLLQEKHGKTTATSVPTSGTVISFECGDILIGNIRPYLKKIWLADCNGGTNGDVLAVQVNDRSSLTPKFLYYVLSSDNFFIYDVQNSKGAKMPRGNKEAIMNYTIPVPPLAVQEEIVRILDNFTALTAELTAELTARKKQYEYYRDELLTFGDGQCGTALRECGMWNVECGMSGRSAPNCNNVTWKTLGEIGSVCMCKRILKEQTSPTGDVPFFKIGTFGKTADAFISKELYDDYKKNYNFPKKGDILISAAGTIGRTVVYDGEPAYFQDSNIVWIDNDEKLVLNRFLLYWYQTSPWKISTGGTIARLYNDNIAGAKVPILPIEIQNKIVSILDRFDSLCNDISEGLPAEIEARQKQYEFYRDALLNYAAKGVAEFN